MTEFQSNVLNEINAVELLNAVSVRYSKLEYDLKTLKRRKQMNRMNRFRSGDIVQHFKRTMLTEQELKNNPTAYLYEVIGYGNHTETHEEFVVYKALYSLRDVHFGEIYIRPKEMFESLVDTEKYPNAKQLYRFEVANEH